MRSYQNIGNLESKRTAVFDPTSFHEDSGSEEEEEPVCFCASVAHAHNVVCITGIDRHGKLFPEEGVCP